MRKLLRQLGKGFKPACLTATLATCWQVGQVAKAQTTQPNWGEEITISFTGTISPATESLSHMFLIYGTGTSGGVDSALNILNLGNFNAGQDTAFSATGNEYYADFTWWYTAALYGDTSSGQYLEGVNGVTLGIWAWEGDSWDSRFPLAEATAFTCLLNDTPEDLPPWQDWNQGWHINQFMNGGNTASAPLFNFSNAVQNGGMQVEIQIVPEPGSIVLLWTGGMIVAARRRRST